MIRDLELEAWRAEWQFDAPRDTSTARLELRLKVKRQRTRMMLTLASEIVLSVAWLTGSAALAFHRPSAPVLVLVAAIWVFVAAALTFSVWNRRGAWRPAGESVQDFVELVRERYRRDLRTARFGMALLLVQVVFILGWTQWHRGTEAFSFPSLSATWVLPFRVLPVVIPVGVYLWLRWWRHRATRELAALEQTRLDLTDAGD